jgi:predicted acetyltransferase
MVATVPELVSPTTQVHASFLDAVQELSAEGQHHHAGTEVFTPLRGGRGETWDDQRLEDADEFARFVRRLVEIADPATERPAGHVPATHLWWVDGTDYLGRLSIRHTLTEALLQYGGHVGYVVRPSARRHGHATAMLQQALPFADRLGVDPALVTCDVGHDASRKVIETAGGVLEDERDGKLRFWVPTSRHFR